MCFKETLFPKVSNSLKALESDMFEFIISYNKFSFSSCSNNISTITNYEYITVHFLRHANATLLLNSGIDLKMVSAHLGHNDIQTTANIYADVLSSQKHKIAQIIEINLENK